MRSERNSSTDYIASFDFSFQAKGVRDLLRREGIPFIDDQAPAVTLVPVWRSAAGAAAAGRGRLDQRLEGPGSGEPLTPVKLQPLRRASGPRSINALAAGDGSAMRALAAAYNTRVRARGPGRARHDGGAPQCHARRHAMRSAPSRCKRPYRIDAGDPGLCQRACRRRRSAHPRGPLEGHQSAGRALAVGATGGGGGGGDTDLLIAVEFRGMGEWQEISRKLSATPGRGGAGRCGPLGARRAGDPALCGWRPAAGR